MNINFQGLLQSTCSVLGFEVGEIWFARKQEGERKPSSACFNDLKISLSETSKFLLRFHQLHISSIFEEDKRALIQPTGFEVYSDESVHKISPYVRTITLTLFLLELTLFSLSVSHTRTSDVPKSLR
jgi:hypothetical protein